MQPNDAHADESDSGDDSDYVPPAHDSDAGREAKRVRMDSPGVVSDAPEDKEAKKGHRDALWASFQSSVATPHLSVPQPSLEKTIKIEKRYKFAGEDVVSRTQRGERSARRLRRSKEMAALACAFGRPP
ncbi:hypothetical protein PHLGIDRAFT_235094 [Phlebiopsis gigantea 11061_1 CR5-6]|uniref:Uncharacterized protein n=1 Tax=Phlebiopsis gigantea (strain 11061_1 CR5-6) TaxID=745531 RepID=A0A0C3NFP6_PHLG1|nr:hypothetical protein PHLGIDRAFT_235094 [Phlebiopsis gigantea 11061_1 CR5-6]